jgi:hypothetical protein
MARRTRGLAALALLAVLVPATACRRPVHAEHHRNDRPRPTAPDGQGPQAGDEDPAGDDADPPAPPPPTTTTTAPTAPAVGPDGEAFYTAPSPLPAGRPGDVIWYRPIGYAGRADVQAAQVLYRSTGVGGAANAVSGSIVVPTTPWAGSGPRPVVGMAPFTRGLGDDCAASKSLAAWGDGMVNEAINRGWAVALTDLEGLGTPERHTYMVGESQGHAVLDVLRAARNLPGSDVRADAPVGLAGYSQGAAAVAWAGEQQKDYAPELQVKGIAAGGVPADLPTVYRALNGGPSSGLVVATALGMDAAYPELALDSYLTDTGRAQVRAAENMCLIDLLAFAGHRFSDYATTDPLTSPAWQARLDENRTGQRAPAAPVLVWRAQDDTVIPAALATQLTQDYCARGATVTTGTGAGEHMMGFATFGTAYAPYLADRFAGAPAASAC